MRFITRTPYKHGGEKIVQIICQQRQTDIVFSILIAGHLVSAMQELTGLAIWKEWGIRRRYASVKYFFPSIEDEQQGRLPHVVTKPVFKV